MSPLSYPSVVSDMFPSIGSFQRRLDRCVGVVQSLGVSSAVTRISSIHHSKRSDAPQRYTHAISTPSTTKLPTTKDNDNQFLTNITRYTTNPNPSIARRVPSNRLFRPLGEFPCLFLSRKGPCVLRCVHPSGVLGCTVDGSVLGSGIGQRHGSGKCGSGRGRGFFFACDAAWKNGRRNRFADTRGLLKHLIVMIIGLWVRVAVRVKQMTCQPSCQVTNSCLVLFPCQTEVSKERHRHGRSDYEGATVELPAAELPF